MKVIETFNLTKEYSPNVGCFDINLSIDKGEVYGFIGPNGAGKTTVIRQLIGFIKPTTGTGKIMDLDIWNNASKIMQNLGYLAGEVALPPYMTGFQYLKVISSIRGDVDWEYIKKLINYFELDCKRKISKMSKGMKQKVAIISAFMHKPKILILDEPTSGLDPLMQEKFKKILNNAKKDGATIFISSHIFGEIESTCDRVGFIKKGKLISEISIDEIKKNSNKIYELQFKNQFDFQKFTKESNYKIVKNDSKNHLLQVSISKNETNIFLLKLNKMDLEYFREVPFDLEQHFLKFYGDEVDF